MSACTADCVSAVMSADIPVNGLSVNGMSISGISAGMPLTRSICLARSISLASADPESCIVVEPSVRNVITGASLSQRSRPSTPMASTLAVFYGSREMVMRG